MSATSKENWVSLTKRRYFRVREKATCTGLFAPQRVLTQYLIAAICVLATPAFAADTPPSVFILDGAALGRSRQAIRSGDATLAPALARLRQDADHALEIAVDPVTNKAVNPPSADKHDYMSIAPYWWPNPNTGDGLPYIRRDGEVNPERDRLSDRKRLDNVIQTVKSLAAGYFFIGSEKYAERAAELLRMWFLDENSRMNPHLRYAQAVVGRRLGRGAGIIETHNLPELIDAAALLVSSPEWNKKDHAGLQRWFADYLRWLVESPEGKAEAKAENNHGSWYDVQVAAFALFVGRDELAKQIIGNFSNKRIARQIEADGRQPRELARTQSWHYAVFNLEAMFDAAAIGDRIGIDLWSYQSADQRGIRTALDWLLPFACGEKTWTEKQLAPFQPEKLAPLLRRAAQRYHEPPYEKALAKIPNLRRDERWRLLFADAPSPKQ
jgi:Alginate lyase